MNSTILNQHAMKKNPLFGFTLEANIRAQPENDERIHDTPSHSPSLLLLHRTTKHHPKAGINPIVDASAYLFSLIGKLKITAPQEPTSTHAEFIHEINVFCEAAKNHDYQLEYVMVCRYILCATIDDISAWGHQYSLLAAFKQDVQHQDKFFTIMERIIAEPALYIDIMELMYVCLSMGYKGRYATNENHYQLEQIINNLYQHIRTYRGNFSKILSLTTTRTSTPTTKRTAPNKFSFAFILIVTACIMMTIFISLGFIMDIISNETNNTISKFQNMGFYTTST